MAIRIPKRRIDWSTAGSKIAVIGVVGLVAVSMYLVYGEPLLHKEEYRKFPSVFVSFRASDSVFFTEKSQRFNRAIIDPTHKHADGLATWKNPFEPRVRAD